MYTGPHIITDGLEGVIDGGSWNRDESYTKPVITII